jgi:ATP-dependent DNA helicase RecG
VDISLDSLYKIIRYCNEPRTRNELMDFCRYKSAAHFKTNILNPLLSGGQIELTIPDKYSSPKQRYFVNLKNIIYIEILFENSCLL